MIQSLPFPCPFPSSDFRPPDRLATVIWKKGGKMKSDEAAVGKELLEPLLREPLLREGSDVARREGRHASPRPERGRRDVGNDRRVLALGQAFMRPKKEGQKRERDESDPRSLPEIWGVMGRGWEWHETHQAS